MASSIFRRFTGDKTQKDHVFGVDVEADLRLLLDEGKRSLPKFNSSAVEKAFRFCVNAHINDLRVSGEPYYTHPLQVALIVIREIPLDDISVMAALLHDVVEDTMFSLKDIESEFGSEVAAIVDGATKISDVFASREITQAENYRKLLLSLVNDVRVILVKFADRLHNMRTIDVLSPERQTRMARETMELYAPFAHRFGLANIKWELEDLSFKVLNPTAYNQIKSGLNSTREERTELIERFAQPIAEKLQVEGLKFEINGRPKHLYSIYQKMVSQGKQLDELYDLFAVRIILDTNDDNDCFLAYGIVSSIYRPVPERFKNYVSIPKKMDIALCTQPSSVTTGSVLKCRYVPAPCMNSLNAELLHTSGIKLRKGLHLRGLTVPIWKSGHRGCATFLKVQVTMLRIRYRKVLNSICIKTRSTFLRLPVSSVFCQRVPHRLTLLSTFIRR